MAIEGETIGTARIDVSVNADAAAAQLKALEREVSTIGGSAEVQYNKATAAQKRYADSLLRQVNMLDKTRAERIALNAQTKIGGDLGDAIAKKALEQQAAIAAATTETGAIAVESAAQQAARLKDVAAAAMAEVDARKATAAQMAIEAKAREASAAATAKQATAGRARVEIAALESGTIKAQMADFAMLQRILDGNIKKETELAAAEAALDRLQKQNAVSNVELAAAFEALNKVTEKNTALNAVNAVSRTGLNSRTQYELGVLAGEVASGNTSRIKRSVPALLNATGLGAKLMTPLGLGLVGVTAALAAFGVSVVRREQEMLAFNKAVAATGDASGMTGLQLQGVAMQVGQSTGQYKNATDAVLALAQSGEVLGSQMQAMATVAVNMAFLTGDSVEKVAKDLIALQGDPTQALAKTAAAMGLLTSEQFNQIVVTQQQQGVTAAAALAMKDLGTASDAARQQLVENAGIVIKIWDNVKTMFGDIGRDITSIGAEIPLAIQVAQAQAKLARDIGIASSVNSKGDSHPVDPNKNQAVIDDRAALADLQRQQRTAAMFAAGQELANQAKQKHDQALAEAMASTKQGDEGFVAQAQAINNKRYAALVGVVDKDVRDKVNAAYDQQIRDAVKRANAQIPHGSPREPSARDPAATALAAFQQQVAQLDARSANAGNTAVGTYVQGVLKLVAGFDRATKAGKNVAEATALYDQGIKALGTDLAMATAKQDEAIKAYQDTVDAQTAAQKAQLDMQVAGLGMGDRELAQAQALAQIRTQSADTLRRLTEQRDAAVAVNPGADTRVLDSQITAEKRALTERLANQRKFYSDVTDAQSQWQVGAVAAIQNFADQAADVAGQTRSVFSTAFGDMTDALSNFVMTGKLSFKSFADDIIKGMLRIELQAAESSIMQSLLGMFATGPAGANMGYFGSFNQSATNTTAGNIVSSIWGPNAKGGVYDSPSLARYANGVYDSPRLFGFARGGVFGEDGPEAIMPLSRGADGKLGVKAGGGSQPIELHINLKNESGQALQAKQQGQATMSGNHVMADFVLSTVAGDVAGGGKTAKAMQQRFGLARAGIPVGA